MIIDLTFSLVIYVLETYAILKLFKKHTMRIFHLLCHGGPSSKAHCKMNPVLKVLIYMGKVKSQIFKIFVW